MTHLFLGTVQPRPFSEWHEDHGDALWFFSPITEPPYCGSPLDCGRAMTVEIQIGFEQIELPTRDVGGWPWQAEDESQLWWLPLPCANDVQRRIDAIEHSDVLIVDEAQMSAIDIVVQGLTLAQRDLLKRLTVQPGTPPKALRFTYNVQKRGAGLQSCAVFVRRQMALGGDHQPYENGGRGYVTLTPIGDLIRRRVKGEVPNGPST